MAQQASLSAFNGDFADERLTRVVVGSFETVAGSLGGLGIEDADLVVVLDEDWSGRGQMLLYSMLARCTKRREMTGKLPCRFIRLLAADSCEATFLEAADALSSNGMSDEAKPTTSNEMLPMFLSPEGVFGSLSMRSGDRESSLRDCWHSEVPGKRYFAFPGINIMAFRNAKLARVLGLSSAPPQLASTQEFLFLPVATSEDEIAGEIALVSMLVKKEQKSLHSNAGESGVPLVSTNESLSSALLCANVRMVHPNSIAAYLDGLAAVRATKSLGLLRASLQSTPLSSETTLADYKGALMAKEERNDEVSADGSGGSKVGSMHVLFYPFSESAVRTSASVESAVVDSRTNLYSSSYSLASRTVSPVDGNQGNEVLPYVPPLLPRILESSRLAKSDAELLKSRAAVSESLVLGTGKKRLATDPPTSNPPAKRQRQSTIPEEFGEAIHVAGSATSQPAADALEVIVPREAGIDSDISSVLLDLSDDYGLGGSGAVPLPRDSALSAAYTFVETSGVARGKDSQLSGEWFSFAEGCDSEEVGRSVDDLTPMSSMILFVSRKRPRGFSSRPIVASQLNRNSQGRIVGNMPWQGNTSASFTAAAQTGHNGIMTDVNGVGMGKRPKKRVSAANDRALFPSSAFTRVPGVDPAAFSHTHGQAPGAAQAPKTMDLYKKGLLATLRQSGTGPTLFEASSFRTASLQIKNRVGSRLIRHCWTSSSSFEIGPGLPLHIAKSQSTSPRNRITFDVDTNLWTSIVKRPSAGGAKTKSDVNELAALQRAAFHASAVAPCRVDFGPFQCGFLSMPSGMTAVTHPRSKTGVSLPMGVKISSLQKDQTPAAWRDVDDLALRQSLEKYGLNWLLVARHIQGFQEFLFVPAQGSAVASSRSCRDRWHILTRKDPDLSNQIQILERRRRAVFRHAAVLYEAGAQDSQRLRGSFFGYGEDSDSADVQTEFDETPRVYLLPSTAETSEEAKAEEKATATSTPKQEESGARSRKSFAAFRRAKDKVQKMPLTIPGVISGSPPSIAPSHSSHMQAVQAALATSIPSARKDVWPLQLLAANRKRDAAASTASTSTGVSRSSATAPGAARTYASASSARSTSGNGHSQGNNSRPRTVGSSPSRSTQPANTRSSSSSSAAAAQSFVPPPNQLPTPAPSPAIAGQPKTAGK